jgi:MFS family permease
MPALESPVPERAGTGALLATAAGNALEFYDFLVYSFFAVYIGAAFFPAGSAFVSLLLSVATFGIGFVTRPVGAALIGAYADRAGRKPALLLTIALMTAGTLAVAATPSYAAIGVAAPLILVAGRLLQGLALGGDVGPATSVLLESAPPGQRGLYSSLQGAGQAVAVLGSGVVGLGLASVLTEGDLARWGWRVAFALGLAIVPVGFFLRRRLPETLGASTEATSAAVLARIWRHHRRAALLVILVTMCMTVGTYVGAYLTTYAQVTLHMPPWAAMLSPVANGLVLLPGSLLGGVLADRFGRKPVMIASRVVVIALIYPAFLYLAHERTPWALALVTAALSFSAAPGQVASVATMGEIFPPEVRSSGLSLTYSLGVAIFGGTTQVVITWLIGATGNPLSPAFYVIATSAVSLVAMMLLPETSRSPG